MICVISVISGKMAEFFCYRFTPHFTECLPHIFSTGTACFNSADLTAVIYKFCVLAMSPTVNLCSGFQADVSEALANGFSRKGPLRALLECAYSDLGVDILLSAKFRKRFAVLYIMICVF